MLPESAGPPWAAAGLARRCSTWLLLWPGGTAWDCGWGQLAQPGTVAGVGRPAQSAGLGLLPVAGEAGLLLPAGAGPAPASRGLLAGTAGVS